MTMSMTEDRIQMRQFEHRMVKVTYQVVGAGIWCRVGVKIGEFKFRSDGCPVLDLHSLGCSYSLRQMHVLVIEDLGLPPRPSMVPPRPDAVTDDGDLFLPFDGQLLDLIDRTDRGEIV